MSFCYKMAYENESTDKTKIQIYNEKLYANKDLQHTQEMDCSTKKVNEPHVYQNETDIKEKFVNRMSIANHMQHKDDGNTNFTKNTTNIISNNCNNQQDCLVIKEENNEIDINDDLGSCYDVEHNDCKIEIKEEFKNNLANQFISSNVNSINSTETEKDDVSNTAIIQSQNLKRSADELINTHTAKKSYVCDICSRIYSQLGKLIAHQRTHTGEKTYICHICSKAFAQSKNLRKHKYTHTGEKPHVCDVCSKAFAQARFLVVHKRIHTGEKSFVCNICSRGFSHISTLIGHKRTHTGEKPYVCDVCSKAFAQHSNLVAHKRIHTGEKSYVCNLCSRGFSNSSALTGHKRTHTGEKPYVCEICSKAFAQASTLAVHKRLHILKHVDCSSTDLNETQASRDEIDIRQEFENDMLPVNPLQYIDDENINYIKNATNAISNISNNQERKEENLEIDINDDLRLCYGVEHINCKIEIKEELSSL